MVKTGTKEWSNVSKNILKGCYHNCRYCYARANMLRYKQIPNDEAWKHPKLSERAMAEKPRKVDGVIMFPTTHDILPEAIKETIEWLDKWLAVGNEILIVSKPHPACIRRICDELAKYKSQLKFRFTIGSMRDDVLTFWEEGAPIYSARVKALQIAFDAGFQTSVSCEPYLDDTIEHLVRSLYSLITDTIWIGKMNKVRQRVNMDEWGEQEYAYLHLVESVQSDKAIHQLYERLKSLDNVRWKDSCKKILGLPEEGIG